jgi:hypothetical protein
VAVLEFPIFCFYTVGFPCAGVISLDSVDKQNVTLDVMPLIAGFLPLPLVRLSKYIPADHKTYSRGMYNIFYYIASLWYVKFVFGYSHYSQLVKMLVSKGYSQSLNKFNLKTISY